MKKIFVFLFYLMICVSLFSEDLFSYSKVLYEHDSEFYDELYLTCMENGVTLLSYKKPISLAEAFLNYKKIDEEKLSPAGKQAYDNLTKLFYSNTTAFSSGKFSLDYNVDMALEAMYLHNPKKEPNIDKLYRYNKSQEPIKIPLEFYITKYTYMYVAPYLGKNYSAFNLSYPYTNIPLAQNALDYHFPKETGLSIGNSFFNAHIGRGQLNIGRTLSGSMLLSDSHDRLDFLSINTFFDFIKFDMTFVELEPTSFLINHSLSIRPVKQLSISFHEGIMLDSVFDPKFINPFMIFHNYAPWHQYYVGHGDKNGKRDANSIGCQLGLDINIVPVKNLRIYGQFGMNQFQTPSEVKAGNTNVPNSMGGIAGIEYIFPLKNGHLILTGEFEYADPWLYIGFGGYQVSFFTHRKENVYASDSYDKSRIDFWLANPYGPDTIGGFLKVRFIAHRKYEVYFLYRFLAEGENGKKFINYAKKKKFYYPNESYQETTLLSHEESIKMAQYKTPSGTPTYYNTLSVAGKYNIWKGLHVKGKLSWTIAAGKISGHSIDFSTAISYSIRQK